TEVKKEIKRFNSEGIDIGFKAVRGRGGDIGDNKTEDEETDIRRMQSNLVHAFEVYKKMNEMADKGCLFLRHELT
ncbi:hypothetical protein O9G_006093, partial [Rozella allomycis CSF55]